MERRAICEISLLTAVGVAHSQASARPFTGGSCYILYEVAGKSGDVILYGNAYYSLCIEQESIDEYDVGKAVQSLKRLIPYTR